MRCSAPRTFASSRIALRIQSGLFPPAATSVGISTEDLARLGKPFEQAGDAGQKQSGSGLGLSLVRAFARLHGGDMTMESRLGEGTTVTVRLPVLVAASEDVVPLRRAAEG